MSRVFHDAWRIRRGNIWLSLIATSAAGTPSSVVRRNMPLRIPRMHLEQAKWLARQSRYTKGGDKLGYLMALAQLNRSRWGVGEYKTAFWFFFHSSVAATNRDRIPRNLKYQEKTTCECWTGVDPTQQTHCRPPWHESVSLRTLISARVLTARTAVSLCSHTPTGNEAKLGAQHPL